MVEESVVGPPGPVLAIESSCDETAVALLAADGTVLAEALHSQVVEHARWGGVVPEIAARAHLDRLPAMVAGVLAGQPAPVLVAATAGPGLIGGLVVGATFAKGFALARAIPFAAINHLEAHALSARIPWLEGPAPGFPYLTLLISGGHCLLVETRGPGAHAILGTTLDDAPGEAFDKVAKMLGLGWPGGPLVERLAHGGDAARFGLPRPMVGRRDLDFSFSGLKTAVATIVARGGLDDAARRDLAAGFQASVAASLADRARRAMEGFGSAGAALVVSGGVAANGIVRAALAEAAARTGFTFIAPPIRLCTDNAVMVGWAAIERARACIVADDIGIAPRPRWPLDQLAA